MASLWRSLKESLLRQFPHLMQPGISKDGIAHYLVKIISSSMFCSKAANPTVTLLVCKHASFICDHSSHLAMISSTFPTLLKPVFTVNMNSDSQEQLRINFAYLSQLLNIKPGSAPHNGKPGLSIISWVKRKASHSPNHRVCLVTLRLLKSLTVLLPLAELYLAFWW